MSGDSGREGAAVVPDVGSASTGEQPVEQGKPEADRLREDIHLEATEEGVPGTDKRDEAESGSEESNVPGEISESDGRAEASLADGHRSATTDIGTDEDPTDGSDNTQGENLDLRVENPPSEGDAKAGSTTDGELGSSGAPDSFGFSVDVSGNTVRWRNFEAS